MFAKSEQLSDVEIIMDAQLLVKEYVQKSIFNIKQMFRFDEKILWLIDNTIKEVGDEDLKIIARQTLFRFAKNEYLRLCQLFDYSNIAMYLASASNGLRANVQELQNQLNEKVRNIPIKELNKGFSQLGNSQPKVSFSQSLYGRAELQARYNEQQEMLEKLKKETKLVICDTHSDCSKRCSRWQGKIYSLDGTYGVTEDGEKYMPLEVAVNNSDYGRNNGLLGYNCRHKLHKYTKGAKAIVVNERERIRENAITEKQRVFEREIRKAKEQAMVYKENKDNKQFNVGQRNAMNRKYNYYKGRAEILKSEYVNFCHENNRVEYRSRIKI